MPERILSCLPAALLAALCIGGGLAADDSSSQFRTWTAVTGHRLEARFLELDGRQVRLLRADGKSARIKLDALSAEDRELAQRLAAAADPWAALARSPVRPKRWLQASVGEAPKERAWDPFYRQHVDCRGLPIIASADVRQQALLVAHRWVQTMTAERPELLRQLVLRDVRLAVIGRDEVTTDIPEYRGLTPADVWNQTRGVSADENRPVVSVAEENLLLLQPDSYRGEQVLVHELAHTLHQVALPGVEPDFDGRLRAAYRQAMTKGLWRNTHAAANHREYFAEGAQSWFDVNRQSDPPDGVHGPVDTRAELKKYDPPLAALLDAVFP